jgi:hypothetical protein
MPAGEMSDGPLTVGPSTRVRFFQPLFICAPQQDGEAWIVGHEPSDIAVELPAEGVAAIESLEAGATVAEAILAVRERCGDEVDVVDLLLQLAAAGLVATIDERVMTPPRAIGQRWVHVISPTLAGAIASRPVIAATAMVGFIGLLLVVVDPAVRPRAHDLYWSPSYALDILTLIVLGPLLIVKHELGHLLAARKYGLAAELTIDSRLVYLVTVSQVAGVWRLPRRQRLFIYSAGMLNDIAVAGLCALLVFAASLHIILISSIWLGFLHLVVLSEYLAVAWECQIFVKTDVYHIFADLTGRHDLPDRARALVVDLGRSVLRARPRIARLLRRRLPPQAGSRSTSGVTRGEATREYAPDWLLIGYTLFAVIGVSATLVWFALYFIPATAGAIRGELVQIGGGGGVGGRADQGLAVADAWIALAFQAGVLGFLLSNWARQLWHVYRRWHQGMRGFAGTH